MMSCPQIIISTKVASEKAKSRVTTPTVVGVVTLDRSDTIWFLPTERSDQITADVS